MQNDAFITATVDWLNRRVAPAGVTVDADTRLFDAGIIDSLGILRLIAWTEHATGRRIDDRDIRMDRFGSVRAIATHYAAADDDTGATQDCARCGRCGVGARCVRRAA